MAGTDTRLLTVRGQSYFVRRFAVEIVDGADRGARVESTADELAIGSDAGNHLVLRDPSVSRHHCTLRATPRGLEVRDLGSTNGTLVGGCELVRGFVPAGARLRLGQTTLAIDILGDEIAEPLAADDRFGELLGASPAMRRVYPLIARYAGSDATVLITGETGTGKELAAEAIHRAGPRRDRPFVVVSCGALPGRLTESELFGHARGAFTGADRDRVGAFESAHGGTLFLDEIGELPPALQPLLLRALEARTVRPIGGARDIAFDARVIAATHRDLRVEINHKRFRSDLYYRLHVLPLELPPLRERAGDVELLANKFWSGVADGAPPPDLIETLARQSWPGNVRELRNAVERAALIGGDAAATAGERDLSYGDAKARAIAAWERDWVVRLLERHAGNLSAAARDARMGRSHLRTLIHRHGIVRPDDDADDDRSERGPPPGDEAPG